MQFVSLCRVLVISFAMTIVGCSGQTDEAKKLGFSSLEEMKEIHGKGWHTKDRFEEDLAKQQGYSSAAIMRATLEKNKKNDEMAQLAAKERDEKAKLAAEEIAMARKKYARSDGDIGLFCTYSDNSGSNVIIYSESKNIQLMGEWKDNNWKPIESLRKISENNIEISFRVVNEVVESINKNSGLTSELTINRESLKSIQYTHLRGGVNVDIASDSNCKLLEDDRFSDLVMQVMNARDEQKRRNKL